MTRLPNIRDGGARANANGSTLNKLLLQKMHLKMIETTYTILKSMMLKH